MKFLVATSETQGQRVNDFFFAKVNELLRFGTECSGEEIDGECGCRRCMIGTITKKGTTTMKVSETGLAKEQLIDVYYNDLRNAGWKLSREDVAEDVERILRISDLYPEGTVLEKRGNEFKRRK